MRKILVDGEVVAEVDDDAQVEVVNEDDCWAAFPHDQFPYISLLRGKREGDTFITEGGKQLDSYLGTMRMEDGQYIEHVIDDYKDELKNLEHELRTSLRNLVQSYCMDFLKAGSIVEHRSGVEVVLVEYKGGGRWSASDGHDIIEGTFDVKKRVT